jgi:hypothetical protein
MRLTWSVLCKTHQSKFMSNRPDIYYSKTSCCCWYNWTMIAPDRQPRMAGIRVTLGYYLVCRKIILNSYFGVFTHTKSSSKLRFNRKGKCFGKCILREPQILLNVQHEHVICIILTTINCSCNLIYLNNAWTSKIIHLRRTMDQNLGPM